MFDYSKLTNLLEPRPNSIALCGAGGKTTTMYALGRYYAARGLRVLLTTTTKLHEPEPGQVSEVRIEAEGVSGAISAGQSVLLARTLDPSGKILGYEPDVVEKWLFQDFDILIYEADGAAEKSIKAPRSDEPRLASNTDVVIGCVGLDALGMPLDEAHVHRSELFRLLTGAQMGALLTESDVVELVLSEKGLFQHAGPTMRKILLLTKADDSDRCAVAARISERLAGWNGAVIWI